MKRILAASLAVAALAAGAGTASAADPGEEQLYRDRYGTRYYNEYSRPYAYRSYGYAPAYGYYDYGPSVGFSVGFGPAYRSYYW